MYIHDSYQILLIVYSCLVRSMFVEIWIFDDGNRAMRIRNHKIGHTPQYYPVSSSATKTNTSQCYKHIYTCVLRIMRIIDKKERMKSSYLYLWREPSPLLPMIKESSFRSSTASHSFSLASPQYSFVTT